MPFFHSRNDRGVMAMGEVETDQGAGSSTQATARLQQALHITSPPHIPHRAVERDKSARAFAQYIEPGMCVKDVDVFTIA